MRNRIPAALAAALLMFTLFSCGKAETAGEVNLEDLAKTLLADGTFTDALALIDDDTIAVLYGIDNAVEQYVYIGSGATPEEIALFSFATAAEAEAGYALAQMRIADQKEAFSDYNAWEMPKLEDAVVRQYGLYVALCVSGDGQAEMILEENLG